MSEVWHVYPTEDEREHDTNKGPQCHCNPKLQNVEGGTVVIHNAYDCREFVEEAEVIKDNPDKYL